MTEAHPIPTDANDENCVTFRVSPTPGDPFGKRADWRMVHMGVDWQIEGVAVDSDGSVLLMFKRYSLERMKYEIELLEAEQL